MNSQDRPLPEAEQSKSQRDGATVQGVRKELHWLEILNFAGQIILAVVGIVAVVIYGHQLREMKRTNDLSSRPWIAFDAKGIDARDGFHFNDERTLASTTLYFYLANTGHSPAYVAITGRFVDTPDPKKVRGEVGMAESECQSARNLLTDRPLTVVPSSASLYGIAYEGGDSDSTTQRGPMIQLLPDSSKTKSHFVPYYGCIAYQSIADPGIPHQTPFKIYFNIDASGNVPKPEQPILVGEAK